jgi:hypothetical protein
MIQVKQIPGHKLSCPHFKVTDKEWRKFAIWFNRNPVKNSKTCGFMICEHGAFLYTTDVSLLTKVIKK